MLDNVLQSQGIILPWWIGCIIILGSIVDIFQFLWIIKRNLHNIRRKYYNRVLQQAKIEVLDKITNHSK